MGGALSRHRGGAQLEDAERDAAMADFAHCGRKCYAAPYSRIHPRMVDLRGDGMVIWLARSIDDVPEVILMRWRIFETEEGERHFVGTRHDRGTGRVSSAIVNIDMSTRVGVTRSGRKYVLDGPPGTDVNGECTWAAWCHVNGVTRYRDVTDDLLMEGRGGLH